MHRFARIIAILSALLWMAACQAAIQQQEQRKAEIHYFNATVDRQRILVSTGDLSNPHEKLGDLSYTEPLNADTIDSTHINEKLRNMAIEKWGTQVDALIDVKSTPSADATMITGSGEAVRVIGDCNFCRHNYTPEEMK
jgi:cytoskeletal protein RodZ